MSRRVPTLAVLVLLAAACRKGDDHRGGVAAPARAGDARGGGAVSLTPEPIVVAGQPLDGAIHPRVQAGAITGEDDRARAAFAITGPGASWTFAWDDLSVLAVPERSWMARRVEGREMDPKAADLTAGLVVTPAGPAVDRDHAVAVLPPGEEFPRPLAALGAGAERTIVLVRETMDVARQTLYDLAQSRDGGKTWTLVPGPPDVRSHSVADVHADRVSGTVDILLRAHHETGEVMLLLQLDGAHPLDVPPAVEVDRFDLERACRRDGATWWLGDDGHLRRAQRGTVTTVAGDPLPAGDPHADGEAATTDVIDCAADAALVVSAGAKLSRCKAAGCEVVTTPFGGAAALAPDGTVIGVVADGNQLQLWREGAAQPATFTLPAPMLVEGAVVWSDAPYAVVAAAEDGAPELVKLAAP